ncbi:NUDIX domain-containing protein [Jiella sp. MQZ13P-4]|uniref:NUDIX domain-containing protein n=2 Tax=Jiella sonneratiae TaxID=2816856 RepID=A0ABS3J8K2_9HYPH|nr:NUDIX domain-containing protein [Jiella sonneratiae]MBO0905437.1 NUDIX domain-containing protein [Jiella sonneratiae]
MHGAHLLTRPMTLGVRGAAFDEAGRIFLVRHTYLPGWYMPGGGVDPGETVEEALHRECAEEGNLSLTRPPELVSVYYNRAASKHDHVLLYRCEGVVQSETKRPDREIAEAGFFPLDGLPDDLTAATRRRLDELAGAGAPDPYW